MKKVIIAAIIVVLIGAGLLIFYKTRDSGVKFKTEPVQRGSLRATVTATGNDYTSISIPASRMDRSSLS